MKALLEVQTDTLESTKRQVDKKHTRTVEERDQEIQEEEQGALPEFNEVSAHMCSCQGFVFVTKATLLPTSALHVFIDNNTLVLREPLVSLSDERDDGPKFNHPTDRTRPTEATDDVTLQRTVLGQSNQPRPRAIQSEVNFRLTCNVTYQNTRRKKRRATRKGPSTTPSISRSGGMASLFLTGSTSFTGSGWSSSARSAEISATRVGGMLYFNY